MDTQDWKSFLTVIVSRLTPKRVSIALIVLIAIWYAILLPVGGPTHTDEFYTLDRSSSFARFDDWWNVYSMNGVSFRKPPLQYWMSGFLLGAGVGETVALRLPSFVFALGALLSIALLAQAIVPHSVWIFPVAFLLASTSENFWELAISGMLDSGGVFSVALALAAAILALRAPRWWYVVALATGFGALQKAPSAFLMVVLFVALLGLTSRWHAFPLRRVFSSRHFWASAALACGLTASWYVWQYAQHGPAATQEMIGEQMIDRFAPSSDPREQRSFGDVVEHIVDDDRKLVSSLGLLLVFALPFWLRRPELLPLAGIVVIYGTAVGFAGGYISPRYSVYLWPLLAASVAAAAVSLPVSTRLRAALVFVFDDAATTQIYTAGQLGLRPDAEDRARIEILRAYGASPMPTDTRLFCWWQHPKLPPGAVTHYASPDGAFVLLGSVAQFETEVASGQYSGRIRGVCATGQMEVVRATLPSVTEIETIGDYVHWYADAAAR